MYAGFHRAREQIPADSIIDIRYEDLIAAPVEVLRKIYTQLQLGEFESVESEHRAWAEEQHRKYRVSKHKLPAEKENKIRAAWPEYFARYGYTHSPAATQA